MATVIPKLMYREHCIKQGRDNIPTLTRKQKKALKQHNAATAGKDQSLTGYKAKTTVIVEPRFNIIGEIVGFVPKG
jgi:hypothetical protein